MFPMGRFTLELLSMGHKVLIIAEAGVNHNGDIALAERLVDVAAFAGADFVKFQTFSADRLVTQSAKKASYQQKATGSEESQLEMLRRLELGCDAHFHLVNHAASKGIGFLSTAFDEDNLDFLVSLGIPLIKMPSGEITNLPYLRHVASHGKPVVLSTGMATLDEIGDALAVLENGGLSRADVTVLHCATEYPVPMADVNLRAMQTIRDAFGVAVGYSDHTLGIEVAIAAVAMGAKVVEKHFTLDCDLPGPDHRASLPPEQLVAMVRAIRNIELALGSGDKRPSGAEAQNMAVARKSIVAARAIRTGELFSADNLTVKRPGTGISPMRWDELIGSPANRAYAVDELIEP
jgi:N,N'-diacetyllegionaminate synthase